MVDDDACDPRPAPRPCRGRVRWAGRVAAAKCRHYHAKHTAAAIKIPRPGDTPLKRNIYDDFMTVLRNVALLALLFMRIYGRC